MTQWKTIQIIQQQTTTEIQARDWSTYRTSFNVEKSGDGDTYISMMFYTSYLAKFVADGGSVNFHCLPTPFGNVCELESESVV